MKSEWYKDWFNTDEYLLVYKHRDRSEAEILKNLVLKNVEREKVKLVLDMACGSGRHAISFAQAGFDVTAIDLSENLLNVAKSNAEKEKVNVDFILSDIRKFNPEKKFDLVLNLFTSLGYFEKDDENAKVVQKAFELMNSGGWFVLDYFNKNYILNNLIPITVENIAGKRITQTREIKNNRVEKNIIIRNGEKESHYQESVRLYSKEEVIKILERTGFEIVKIFGDFDGSKFDANNSPRLIVFSKK